MAHSASSSSRGPPATDETRQHIIASLFSRRGDDGTPEETLISYLKVYEDDQPGDAQNGEGAKTRYLMLAVTKLGKVVIHKAKRNTNLTFSKGKTWNLEDMRVLESMGPLDFALTMTIRRYHWSSERAKDQTHFLNSLVKVYKTYTKGELPELINFDPPGSAPPNGGGSSSRSVTPSEPPASSPMNIPSSLQPPQPPRTQRNGSVTSLASSQQGSYYGSQTENVGTSSRGRSHGDEDTRGGSSIPPLGRSPLSEANFSRRPSAPEVPMSAREQYTPAIGQSIGMGPPPTQRKMSHGDQARMNGGSAEGYQNGATAMGKRPSGDGTAMRPPADSGRPSSSKSQRSIQSRGEPNDNYPSPMPIQTSLPSSSSAQQPNKSQDIREGSSSTSVPAKQLAPTITTTFPSPLIPSEPKLPTPTGPKPNRRASFHPPPLNTAFSREVLLTSRTGVLPGGAGLTIDDDAIEETEDSVLANVEELLDGFDWTATTGKNSGNGRKKGSADAIESRLLDELAALDSANIHAFLESDDRITQVLGHIDEALLELDDIDMQITGYRMQLNAVSDDISFIESQNRGLQVQTSNQQALLNEIRQLLQIVEVPPEDLRTLTQESPGTEKGVQVLEKAAASLYKALMAGRDTANAEVAATIARMQEYQQSSAQFCTRLLEYLDITFKYQSETAFAEYKRNAKKNLSLAPHESMGEYLMRYQGLVLYVKEMDEDRYQRLCTNYTSTISGLHQNEMKDLLMNLMGIVNSSIGPEANEASFAVAAAANAPKTSAVGGVVQRSRTAIGLKGSEGTSKRDKTSDDASRKPAELFQKALMDIINVIATEESFVQAFLHLTDTESTFADHMELESYFRRQAARHATKAMSNSLMQLARSLMDLMFGFVDGEFRNWIEAATERNPISIVGIIAVTERLAKDAEEEEISIFFSQLLSKQLARQQQLLDVFVNDQIRAIEAAKVTVKKRKGVAFFVRHFPTFVEKMEIQLEGSDDLDIRTRVDGIYERVIGSVFGSLQQLAKMDRADGQAAEDKGQLNYHVIMIENMHHFVEDVSRLDAPALRVYLERARGLYEENLSTYVKMVLRRSFARLMDFFDGVERLLQTTPASEVSLHASYNRSALKKVLKDTGAKDMRKAVEAMGKRVDKHFTDDESGPGDAAMNNGPLIAAVWREITNELKKETTRANEMIRGSFGDSNLGLEFGVNDVEVACKRGR